MSGVVEIGVLLLVLRCIRREAQTNHGFEKSPILHPIIYRGHYFLYYYYYYYYYYFMKSYEIHSLAMNFELINRGKPNEKHSQQQSENI